jgi:integrase
MLTKSDLVAWVAGIEEYTLATWADKYLEIWIAESCPSPGTIATARRYIGRIKKASFAHLNIRDVTTMHCAGFLDAIEKDSVALNMRARMHDMFRVAETKGVIETGKNPVAATKPRAYEVKRERLSLEQFLAIRAKVSPWAANGMTLALLTGQRISDIVKMQFVDYKAGWLYIEQEKTGIKLQQDGRIRLDAIGMSIDEAVKQCRGRVISKYLIHHRRSSGNYKAGEQVSADGLSSAFAKARDACGIVAAEGRTPPTFHEIRSLAERLYRKEYGQEFAQAIMGHKHAKTTAEYDDLRGGGWALVQAK